MYEDYGKNCLFLIVLVCLVISTSKLLETACILNNISLFLHVLLIMKFLVSDVLHNKENYI